MLAKITLLAALVAGTTATMSCGAPRLTNEQKVMLHVNETELLDSSMMANVNIDTYVHIVSKSKSAQDGYLSKDTIDKQMRVLNDDFSKYGWVFNLKDIDWTVNSQWATNGDSMGMKRKLRKGNYATLNLYFITDIGQGNTGYCFYPTSVSQGSEDFYRDGCTMSAWTAPGGGNSRFSYGRITTHQVGHWGGLIHTFEGNSCTGYGDYVDDTPAQASASKGCPSSRDSCPNHPGQDPIHNHMDYTDDTCRTEFTKGQMDRMASLFRRYRRA